MNHLNNKVALLIAIVFSLACVQMVSAGVTYSPTYANTSENFMLTINISTNSNNPNVTQIIVVDESQMPFAVNYTSNSSSITTPGAVYFVSAGLRLVWFNLSDTALVPNGSVTNFTIWMNNSMAAAPSARKIHVCLFNSTNTTVLGMQTRLCSASDPSFISNQTITIGVNFGFTGYVKNDTGDLQPGTNVTIYDYVTTAGGPPSEIPLASAISESNGMFRLWGINGTGATRLYKIKLVYNNSAGRATLVGPNLPPFPSTMFYNVPPPPGAENMPMFKKMPAINGSTFYLQSAATINISAVANVPDSNSTSNAVKFGYEVVDQAVGFPIESNVRTGVLSKEVIVPIGRSYTIIVMRDPVTFLSYDWCRTDEGINEMNDTACPSPPTSMQVTSTNLTQGGMVQAALNLSYSMQYLSGCLSLSGNISEINITSVITRLTPWEGFVPPIDAKISAFDITNSTTGYAGNLVYRDKEKCNGSLAFYNMSLMGSSSGIGYLIEFYGKNASNEAGNPGNAVNLGAFQNLTMTESSKVMNITLKPLAGAYQVIAGTAVNTTKMKLFVQNSSGAAITTSMHVQVKVKHLVFGTMNYIIEDISNGVAYLPILANSTWAKVSIYPNEAPPVEKTLNLAATQNNITVQVGEFTFRKPLANGSLEFVNVSNKANDASTGINMTFYRNGEGCNEPNPPSSCLLTQMDANDFNPMLVMMAGKVNLELKMTSSGTTLYFINFDLLSAKPPTNSIMNNNATTMSASSQTQTWEQGSFVPHVYDHAYVVMPYNATAGANNYINESYSGFNMSLPFLKDENWAVVWNMSTNTTAQLPDDYTDFNAGSYAPLLTSAGAACSLTNTTDVCYWDKTNNWFVLKVPHFSGVGSGITGLAPVAPTGTAAPDTGSSSGSSLGATETEVSESRIFANIAADSENTYRVSNAEKIGINALLFTATEALENVRVSITKLVSKPSSISPNPVGGIYRYIEIDAPKLEGKIKQAIIQFEVTKKWLEDNEYEPEHIRLSRFADGSWRELTTSILTEESDRVYYESTSPGFSYFAITAKKAAEETPAKTSATAEETPTAPELPPVAGEVKESITGNVVKTLLIIIGVLVVLFLAVLGYRKKHLLIFWREPTDKERQQYLRGEFLNRKKQQSFGSGRD